MKKWILMLIIVLMCMCACASDRQEEYLTPRQLANQQGDSSKSDYMEVARFQSETMVSCITNADVEGFASLFCPYMIENTDGLEEQIVAFFDFVDGEIVSYDEPDGYRSMHEMTEKEGTVEESISGEIANIKTSTGKTYRMGHGANSVYKEHPEYVGVTNITIIDEDMYDPETGYPDEAKCVIRFPETYN